MRIKSILPEIPVTDALLDRLKKKFSIGQRVAASIKCDMLVLPTWALQPVEVSITLKERRSIPQLGLYRWVCRWLERNTPEEITLRIGGPISEEAWHQAIMGRYGITSTKFELLDQDGFQEYFSFVGRWLWDCFQVHVDDVIIYMRSEEG